jgi:hypothetical protein
VKRRGRPCRRRAAEKRDKLAPPHVLPSIRGCTLPHRGRKYRVVHHSKFDSQCLCWVIFVRSTRSRRSRHVRFAPIAFEPSHRSKRRARITMIYSMTSSASNWIELGTSMPSARAKHDHIGSKLRPPPAHPNLVSGLSRERVEGRLALALRRLVS